MAKKKVPKAYYKTNGCSIGTGDGDKRGVLIYPIKRFSEDDRDGNDEFSIWVVPENEDWASPEKLSTYPRAPMVLNMTGDVALTVPETRRLIRSLQFGLKLARGGLKAIDEHNRRNKRRPGRVGRKST